MQRTIRQVVRTEPVKIYVATGPCKVLLYMPLIRSDGLETPPCWCELSKETDPKPITTKVGLALSDSIIIPFYLEEDDVLWAWSTGEGLINGSVLPWRGDYE